MSDPAIAFSYPVVADGVPGFPREIARLDEARSVIEAARLPLARSQYHWLDAYNRVLLAQATGSREAIEAARLALNLAVAAERAVTAPSPIRCAA